MKSVLLTLLLALSALAAADHNDCGGRGHDNGGGCNEPREIACYARDARGHVYEQLNPGAMFPDGWARTRAIRICRAQSPAPRTCRPAGCRYN